MPFDLAILLGYPEISGGTNVILEHALGLRRLGHRVAIITQERFDPQRLAWKPGAAERLELLAHADCRERVFDLALATWWRSAFDLAHVAAKRYAYFVQSIESRFFGEHEADAKLLADYTYSLPLEIVTEAAWIQRYLREHYDQDAALVRNGIDKQIFRPDGPALEPRPASGLRVLVEGALRVPFKRVELTVDLCRQAGIDDLWLLTPTACDRFPGVRRLLSRVPMPEVGAVYRSCDVLVKLSTVEGMFGPPLEMMHCGGTAITSDVTGHDEYMRHDENGLIAPIGQERLVVEHLSRLLRERTLLDRLKRGAASTAAAWPDWPHAVGEMEAFAHDICNRPVTREAAWREMRRQLKAALDLAGPLHRALTDDVSGWELLRELLKRVARKTGSAFRRLTGFGRR